MAKPHPTPLFCERCGYQVFNLAGLRVHQKGLPCQIVADHRAMQASVDLVPCPFGISFLLNVDTMALCHKGYEVVWPLKNHVPVLKDIKNFQWVKRLWVPKWVEVVRSNLYSCSYEVVKSCLGRCAVDAEFRSYLVSVLSLVEKKNLDEDLVVSLLNSRTVL